MKNSGFSGSIEPTASLVSIKGRVQGVGFRPFVFNLARELGLQGWVQNHNNGVTVLLEGRQTDIQRFLTELGPRAPVASAIASVSAEPAVYLGFTGFEILRSVNSSDEVTEISPDIALCDECLADMKTQEHRIGYPLINCTNCGPRFTIIRDIPYDRVNTTMDVFPMCDTCRTEYTDVTDRRFHAQPVACNRCGPVYELWIEGQRVTDSLPEIIRQAVGELRRGGIIALKGVGGYHLICDAENQQAVLALRTSKGREAKPLAVMFRNREQAASFAEISPEEEQALLSWQRPVLLLEMNNGIHCPLAPSLNEGLSTLGVVLPYMPFHYLLMEHLSLRAIVLTSGNLSEHPILIDNTEAVRRFSNIAGCVITHQRDIFNRVDDSVVRVMAGAARVFRRARGYTPDPLYVPIPVQGILAMGAELVNSFCLGKANRAYLSQYIGDLKNPATQLFYQETIDRFLSLFRVEPELIVTDLHPEYFSTKYGWTLKQALEEQGRVIPLEQVQHHHAHIASCMAEHNLDETVIGVAFDGTGFGHDGHSWGSEIFLANLTTCQRLAHFEYLPMPGGDKAVEQPWRMALSALFHAFGDDLFRLDLPFLASTGREKVDWTLRMIKNLINTPMTCGAGRYFDAVAAMLGLCLRAGYEGEGPMKLEALTISGMEDSYPVETGPVISFIPAFRTIAREITEGQDPRIIATKFHNTIVRVAHEACVQTREHSGIEKVVLSGGVFQNRYLVEHLVTRLQKEKFKVYLHAAVPPNDGGIALGQILIAAKRRENYVLGHTG